MARVTLPTETQQWLQAAISSPDPVVAVTAATAAAAIEQNPPSRSLTRIFDKFYNPAGELNDYIEIKLGWPRESLPTGTMVLKGSDPLADLALSCETTTVPIVYDKGALRWSGRVDVAHDKLKDGVYQVECELVHDRTWLDRILAWPDPWAPIIAQVPFREWWGIGPAITVMSTLIAEQALRIQLGIWELVNNLGSLNPDMRAWLGTLLMQHELSLNDLMQAVTTPICVILPNPVLDTSPWIEIDGRMDTVWKLIQQQLKDNGLDLQVNVWLPGEPQPEGILIPLQVATIVVKVMDRSNVTGFSGTFLDGAEIDLVQLEGSLLGGVTAPFLNPQGAWAPPGVEIAPALGVNYTIPWVLFNADNPKGGIIEHDIAHHHPLCWQVVTGGKSPKWLDDFFNATFEYLIDAIGIVAGVSIPNGVLDGALDDLFLAFSLVEYFDRRLQVGPYGFPEKFFPSGASAFTLDAFFAEIAGGWDSRGYPTAIVSFLDGYPYELGRDLFPNAQAITVRRNKMYADYVSNITITDTRTDRNRVEVVVGDGKHEEASITKIARKMSGFENALNIATMAN
ncbi:hypothetical protein [Mycobacterium sp. NPDC050853]|uniref:Gp37-like protein n=1 Tax=Mycobacterium sp. NPDC050853 TaxID=3155160 RepID=UPI0033FCA9C4